MSFQNHSTISGSYDLQAQLQSSHRRGCFSQPALHWFEVLPGAPRLVVNTPRFVIGAPRCSSGCHKTSYVYVDVSLLVTGKPEGHCTSPVNSGIWPPSDSGPTTPRHSQRLPVTKIYFADVDPLNLSHSSWPGSLLYPLTLFLCSASQNCSLSPISSGCHKRCGKVLTTDSLTHSSSSLLHCGYHQTYLVLLDWYLYSQVHLNATALVQLTLGFNHSGILVQPVPNTPRGSQWLKFISLMLCRYTVCLSISRWSIS